MTAYSSYEEEKLLIRLSRNDTAAFTLIYLHYWKRLFALAYDRLKSKEASEDIVQEVLSGLWLRRKTISIRSLDAYLSAAVKYAILRNLANDKQCMDLTDDIAINHPFDFYFLEKMVQQEINRLPEKCKLVFRYSRDHGLSNKEIAVHLQVSEKAVEKHITKAIRKLRSLIRIFSVLLFFSV